MKDNRYYTLPLQASKILSGSFHDSCSINESIAHYIHLVNTSYFGECTFDEDFGSAIWLVDFDNLKSSNRLKAFIVVSLEESLQRIEKRLSNIRVEVKVKQEELFEMAEANRIKKKIDIHITARIKKTNEAFNYVEYFFLGPLSY
ncbi:MAG: GPW/gp25 family protein [Patiriisocius sp.]|uniref:GPW/gp25 family protein n=1 Tax=Patiriisocius sp. TaxID=2822396 RepID=UPI003EF3E126